MNYDKLIYESRPVKFNDYMSNKYDIVHNELYKDALCSYLNYSIYSLLVEKVLYKLISKFNNFITQYNDVDQFLNFDNILNRAVFLTVWGGRLRRPPVRLSKAYTGTSPVMFLFLICRGRRPRRPVQRTIDKQTTAALRSFHLDIFSRI